MNVRTVHHNLSVKAARTQQGGIKHVWTVCGGHDDDARVLLESIHFNKKLVQCLLAFVVPAP